MIDYRCMRYLLIVFLGSIIFLNSCSKVSYPLHENEKALISYVEFRKFLNKDEPPLSYVNVVAKLDSFNTYSGVDSFIEKLCSGAYPNAKFNECFDMLPIVYDTENYSLRPNCNAAHNVEIPAIPFRCDKNCMVDFTSSKHCDIHLMSDGQYKLNNYINEDTAAHYSLNEIGKLVDSIQRDNFSAFFQNSALINNAEKRDSLCDYYYMLAKPCPFRISMDTSLTFNRLEPLISTIIKSYLEYLGYYVEENMHKKIEELTESDVRLLGKNISLRMEIVEPYELVTFIAPVVADSISYD